MFLGLYPHTIFLFSGLCFLYIDFVHVFMVFFIRLDLLTVMECHCFEEVWIAFFGNEFGKVSVLNILVFYYWTV